MMFELVLLLCLFTLTTSLFHNNLIRLHGIKGQSRSSPQFLTQNGHRYQVATSLRDAATGDVPSEPSAPLKGFGKPKDNTKDNNVVEKDAGTRTYESQAKRGVPEYNIFMRPSNGTETDWIPVGSMTIQRDVKVSKAIYDVEEELLKGTFKLYPKLKAYAELRKDKTEPAFEYGYVLKAFPDEPIVIAVKEKAESGNFLTNWLSKITDPIDTSEIKKQGADVILKQ